MTIQGTSLSCGKKGLKAQRVKAASKKIKSIENENLEMLRPGDPREGNKRPLDKKLKGP
jgi:hypothetical protein